MKTAFALATVLMLFGCESDPIPTPRDATTLDADASTDASVVALPDSNTDSH